MASQTRTFGLLAVVILAVMGAALWMVFSGDEAPTEKTEEPVAEVAETTKGTKEVAKKKAERARKRSRPKGTAALFGLVTKKVGENAEPAAGQVVQLLFPGADTLQSETDEEGAFRFEKLPHGSPYEVRVTAQGYATIRIPGIALERNDQYDLGTLNLDAAVSVTVFVKSMADEALAGAEVHAYANPEFGFGFNWQQRVSQMGVEPTPVASATTDDGGKAHFPELASGDWTFVADKDGYARQGKKGERLRANEETEPVEIHLGRGYRLSGRVLDHEEAAIPGAHVMAGANTNMWDFQSGPLRLHSTAGADGAYAFDGLPSGNITLWAAKGDGVPTVVATLRVPAVDVFDMHLRSGGILKGNVTVKDEKTPIEGAIVRATGWSGGGYRIAEATTDAEGNYVIDDLLEGNVNSVTAEKEGWVQVYAKGENQWQQIGLTEGGEVVKNIELAKGSTLTGVVTGPSGPLSGVRLTVYAKGANWANSRTGVTDGEGRYEIAGLSKGKGLVQLSKPGYYQPDFPQNWWQAVQQGNGPAEYSPEIPDGEDSEFDMTMKAGIAITGKIVDSEQNALAGVTVRASVIGTNSQLTATTKKDGTFTIEGAAPGKQLNFWTQKRGYRAGTKQMNAPEEGAEQEELEIEMGKTAKVTGMVSSTSGEPMDDAYVYIRYVQNQQQQFNPFGAGNTVRAPVRSDGSYELELAGSKGKFEVVGAAFGHADGRSDAVEIIEDQDSYQVDLVLEEGFSLRGQVNAADAPNGVNAATVTITVKQNNPRGGMSSVGWGGGAGVPIVAVTDGEGRFEVKHIEEGSWSIKVDAQGYVQGSGDAKIPGTSDVTIDLEPSLEISGTVSFADGKPVAGASISAQRENSTAANTGFNPWAGGFTTDKNGRYTVRNLYAGTYIVNVTPPWGSKLNIAAVRSDPVEAGTEDFRIVAEAGGVIAGKVTGPNGKGVEGVFVNANPMKHDPKMPMAYRNTQTDENGEFELVGLADVQYRLHVNASQVAGQSYRDVTLESITPGEKNMKIELLEGLGISGSVVDDEGKPVVNQWIQAQYVKQGDEKTPPNSSKNAQLGSKGEFEIKGLVPGTYKLTLQNWNQQGKSLLLQGGDAVQAGTTDLRLTGIKGLSISGRVVDDAGKGIANVWVNANSTRSENRVQRNARTDNDGNFEIGGLEGGTTYGLSAYLQGRPNLSKQDVEPGTTDIKFVMATGLKATGTLVDASGETLVNVSCNFRNVDTKKSAHAMTNNKGAFEVQGLEEGTYEVSYYKQGEDNKWVQVKCGTLNAGDTGVRLQATE